MSSPTIRVAFLFVMSVLFAAFALIVAKTGSVPAWGGHIIRRRSEPRIFAFALFCCVAVSLWSLFWAIRLLITTGTG